MRMDVRRVNRLVSMLLEEMKDLDDEGRDLPIRWNVMHMFSSAQLAEEYVRAAISRYNNGPWTKLPRVTKEEEDMLVNAIVQHSDKGAATDDPLAELLKDVDSLDRYLHGVKTEGAYLERCKRVLAELSIVHSLLE